jgi:hypothetical protein
VSGSRARRLGATLLAAATFGLAATSQASAATAHSTGTLSDGATWIADVPANWNGTLLLYSHGYGTLTAADAPSDPPPNPQATQAALLDDGYALTGSSYDPNGSLWALGSAVRDQFQTLATVERHVLPTRPRQVLAVGTSMGGLISALEDQHANGRIDAALTTCGLVAGAIQLNNYQLDGEYAISKLLASSQAIKLVRFANLGESAASAQQLATVAQQAQLTAQGRARLALAMAFLNVSTWAPNEAMPGVYDYPQQEQEQYDDYFVANPALLFIETARQQIEQAAGGSGTWNAGVNYGRLLAHSSYEPEVRALYERAGLNLHDDLATLTAGANIRADKQAVRWLQQTSVPSGRLQVPELDLHTISDQLVPVQQERYYARQVARAGSRQLLRQAFVGRQNHCNFTPAELVAGVQAVQSRLQSGSWGTVAGPDQLQAGAAALNLGAAAFIPFWPERLSGDNGPFDPFTESIRSGA